MEEEKLNLFKDNITTAIVSNNHASLKIMLKTNKKMVKFLRNEGKFNPILLACQRGAYEIISLLLDYCFSPSIQNIYGYSPTSVAVMRDDPKMLMILNRAKFIIKDNTLGQGAALILSIYFKRYNALEYLLTVYKNHIYEMQKGLVIAIKKNDILALKKILQNSNLDANFKASTPEAETPLLLAYTLDKTEITNIIFNHPKVDLYKTNKSGFNIAHLAVMNLDFNFIYQLCNRKFDFTIGDSKGRTPMHLLFDNETIESAECSEIKNIRLEILNLLLAFDVNPNTQDCFGITPLQAAIGKMDMSATELLLSRGADVYQKNKFGLNALEIAESLKNPLFSNACKTKLKILK